MIRALGLFGFTGGFLCISPDLRQTMADGAWTVIGYLKAYSPYSYIAAGLGTMALVAFMLRPR